MEVIKLIKQRTINQCIMKDGSSIDATHAGIIAMVVKLSDTTRFSGKTAIDVEFQFTFQSSIRIAFHDGNNIVGLANFNFCFCKNRG